MPSDPREPEHYSVDEMMARLQGRDDEEAPEGGKLVTRADGSTAMRVKRRKRRSKQPAKEQAQRRHRLRAVQITVVLALVFVSLLAAGGALVYYNTSPFRARIVSELRATTGAETEIAQLRVTPAGAGAQSLDLQWPDGEALDSLKLRAVEADLQLPSFFGGFWSGDEVVAQQAELRVGVPVASRAGAGQGEQKAKSFFHFSRIRCPKTAITIGDGAKPAIAVRDAEVSFYPKGANDRTELRLNRGSATFGNGLPPFQIDRSLLVFNGGQIDVVGLRLNPPGDPRGVMELAGTVPPVSTARPSTLDVKLTSFPIQNLAVAPFGRFVSGPVDTRETAAENLLTFVPGQANSYRFTALLRGAANSPLKVSGLPCLNVLARLFADERFATPLIDGESVLTLRMDAGGIHLDNLQLEAKGRLMLRGSMSIAADQTLSGELQLGLTPALALADDSGRLHRAFGPAHDGYRWVTVKLSGTASKPRDDFQQALLESPARPAEPAAEDADPARRFEELTKPR
jgi:hypothetical protein